MNRYISARYWPLLTEYLRGGNFIKKILGKSDTTGRVITSYQYKPF